jgi:hypothetical protein
LQITGDLKMSDDIIKQPFGMTDNIYEGENKMSDKFTCSVCGCDDIERILVIEEVLYCLDCMTNRVEKYESIENKNAELIKENERLRNLLKTYVKKIEGYKKNKCTPNQLLDFMHIDFIKVLKEN